MLFSTDVAWPTRLPAIYVFKLCRHNQRFPNPYHGGINSLLAYCFNTSSLDFFVALRIPGDSSDDSSSDDSPSDDSSFDDSSFDDSSINNTAYLPMSFPVFDNRSRLVLIVDAQDSVCPDTAELRSNADARVRKQYDELLHKCSLPRLWGLSFLRTSVRVYCYDTSTRGFDPAFEHHPDDGALPRDGLAGAWNIEITSQEGFDRMKAIVGDILGSMKAQE